MDPISKAKAAFFELFESPEKAQVWLDGDEKDPQTEEEWIDAAQDANEDAAADAEAAYESAYYRD